jgi:hypothetical protein
VKLAVITGYSEFFAPLAPQRSTLLPFLREQIDDARMPMTRWTRRRSRDRDHSFVYGEPERTDERVGVFLDYLEDVCTPPEIPVVALPFESLVEGWVPEGEAKLRHFLATVAARYGEGAVSCHRMVLSEASQQVLHRLRERAGIAAPPATTGEPWVPDPERHGELLLELQRNFSGAVLRLAERIVSPPDSGRAGQVSDQLEQNRLLIRTDLDEAALDAALAPGGELYDLLCGSVVPIDVGQHLVATAERG